MSDLFRWQGRERSRERTPWAARLRPRRLEEMVGQEHLLGEGSGLSAFLAAGMPGSSLLYGPPGTGKTTLARIMAGRVGGNLLPLNATSAGTAELRAAIARSETEEGQSGVRQILFVDEIHRLAKNQQEVLLPALEEGRVTLIGATTENPFFILSSALLSRLRIFILESLGEEGLGRLLERAASVLGGEALPLTPEARTLLIRQSGGDGRRLLNLYEWSVQAARREGREQVGEEQVQSALSPHAAYDRQGDHHYDLSSALIKSIRGSDPQAAVYYLARMLAGGEDPRFIARRLLVHAAEDIGLADPRALLIASAAMQAAQTVGMPEARIPLAEAVLYLATAPKSNAIIMAIDRAMAEARQRPGLAVPSFLQDSHSGAARTLGHGSGYLYPHDYPDHHVEQTYLPPELADARFYVPSASGEEPHRGWPTPFGSGEPVRPEAEGRTKEPPPRRPSEGNDQ